MKEQKYRVEVKADLNGVPAEFYITDAGFTRDKSGYVLSFNGHQILDLGGDISTLRVNDNNTVEISFRRENHLPDIILEPGREQFVTGTEPGALIFGISTNKINSNLTPKGGNVKIDYYSEANYEMQGHSSFSISVKEATPSPLVGDTLNTDEYIKKPENERKSV